MNIGAFLAGHYAPSPLPGYHPAGAPALPGAGIHPGVLNLAQIIHNVMSGAPVHSPFPTPGLGGAGNPLPNPGPVPNPLPTPGNHPQSAILSLLQAVAGHVPHSVDAGRPADILHGLGQDSQALQVWEQHHPGAMHTGQHIPGWVQSMLDTNSSHAIQ